ncbi:uncharacterized protein LOC110833711 isoform X2 [Zootermopsis nevadensis]|uniref:uncharacterized protein LOC110833711 isoform X2 n=1 Tax=Zootermopsis nevadensis TaxID=136037 RepID=UPI000B8E297B|nr:uncharacterized protein LOC110833711 isoform X2 [Zootermopsis nevadensis]
MVAIFKWPISKKFLTYELSIFSYFQSMVISVVNCSVTCLLYHFPYMHHIPRYLVFLNHKTLSTLISLINSFWSLKVMSKTTSPIWTTDAAGYNGTSTITTLEAMSPACTGILNHNFKSPDSKHAANLPDVTAAVSTFPIGGMKLFYPQGHLCDDQQYYHNYKTMHDEWYFSGSFTEDPRRSKEVTEL